MLRVVVVVVVDCSLERRIHPSLSIDETLRFNEE